MISALVWVSKGAAQEIPEKIELTDQEFERINKHLGVQLSSAEEDLRNAEELNNAEESNENEMQVETEKSTNVEDLYRLDEYDDEEKPSNASLFSNIKGLAYYDNEEDDPYVKLENDDDDLEEIKVESTDNLILAAKTEDDISHVEVYIYEEQEDNLYVHHDIMLPSFPLCLEWLDFPLGRKAGREKGNYVAIGTFDPQVEIWDLDVIDPVFPEVILGQIPDGNTVVEGKKKKGPARVAKKINPERHVDAVMSISWNSVQRNLIATGSADTTIKLWDMSNPTAAVTQYTHHKNKVQAVAWNKVEQTVLISGGYDKRACAFDSRDPKSVIEWKLTADVECLTWDTFDTNRFYVSTEDGIVQAFDCRTQGKSIFTLHAHDAPVSALDVNTYIPGFLVTGAADKTVKLWNITNDKPNCIISRDLGAGKVFAASFSKDSPYILSTSGSSGKVVVWNLEENAAIRKNFPPKQMNKSNRPEITLMEPDDEPEDEEEIEDAIEEDVSDEDEDMS